MADSNIFSKTKNRLSGKRFLLITIIGISLSWSSLAMAVPVTYYEVFDKNLRVSEGQRAVFNFDLGDWGGRSLVRDSSGVVSPIYFPTVDETAFDGTDSIISALLSFEIGGMDGGNFAPRERIKIKVTGEGGTGETLFNETVYLGLSTFDFNLTGSQLDWLSDGKLRAVTLAVNRNNFDNDFKIRRASLTVVATDIPEPGSFALFGLGLFGLACYRWKRS